MIDIKQALNHALALLSPHSESPKLDAEILLANCLKKTRSFLYAYPEKGLDKALLERFNNMLQQRQQGIPIAYITGEREFWSLPLNVSQATLIPRPETELLVEHALRLLQHRSQAFVLDLGTGSGAIALALAKEQPKWQLTASDISLAALDIAANNARNLKINNVTFLHSRWFSHITAPPFDLIISNPPYIAEQDPHLSTGDIQFEPRQALVSGIDGLDDIRHIAAHSHAFLMAGGWLLLEHGYNQGEAVKTILNHNGYDAIQCFPDWQGHLRVTAGQRKKDSI